MSYCPVLLHSTNFHVYLLQHDLMQLPLYSHIFQTSYNTVLKLYIPIHRFVIHSKKCHEEFRIELNDEWKTIVKCIQICLNIYLFSQLLLYNNSSPLSSTSIFNLSSESKIDSIECGCWRNLRLWKLWNVYYILGSVYFVHVLTYAYIHIYLYIQSLV